MTHETELITTIAIGLVAALFGGLLVARLRMPPIIGYLIAGMAVGPFTPGFVADGEIASQLAEIGVILLMFGVGIHFSPGDLLAVRSIALPGAIGQITAATLLTIGLTQFWGWSFGEGLVMGLALSVASTVVLLRALEERDAIKTTEGGVAVGWLLVEDLVTVVILAMLPILSGSLGGIEGTAGSDNLGVSLLTTLAKVVVFGVIMLVGGSRLVPLVFARIRTLESSELFTLSTIATAMGVAYVGYEFFDLSFALGAFIGGLVVGQSDAGHRAGERIMPLRDTFAVLFFVSVGMLIDPQFLIDSPGHILMVTAIVVIGKTLAAFFIVVVLGGGYRTALTSGAALAQIGEFSFILASLGMSLELLPTEGYNLILAAALVSITLNPLMFRLIDPLEARLAARHIPTTS